MNPGDIVMMKSCNVTNTCKHGSKDKLTMGYSSQRNSGMVFFFLGSTTVEKEHLLKKEGTIEGILASFGFYTEKKVEAAFRSGWNAKDGVIEDREEALNAFFDGEPDDKSTVDA